MSLLQQINERNNAQKQETAVAQDNANAEHLKPDAVQQATDKRAAYSQMMATGDDTEMQEEPAGDEEQQIFTELEMQVVDIINSPQGQQLFKIVDAAQDPVEGIGMAAHDLLAKIKKTAGDIDSEILAAIGESAVEQIVEAYEELKPNVNLNEDQMAEAYSIGLQEWMKNNPNDVDPDMQEYMASQAPEQMA